MPGDEQFHHLIGRVYDASLDPSGWDPVLRDLQDALRADQLVMWFRCPLPGVPGLGVGAEVDMSVRLPADSPYWRENPWRRAMPHVRPGSVMRLTHLVAERDLMRSEFYNEYVRPQGMLYGLVGMVQRERMAGRFSTLAAWRSRQHDEFDDRDLARVRVLIPHLERAVRIREVVERNERERRAGFAALDRLPFGVILTDARLRIVATNELGDALLRRGDALHATQNTLSAATPADSRRLERLVRQASLAVGGAGGEAGGALVLRRRGSADPLQIVVTPLSSDAGVRGATAAVFARGVEKWVEPDPRTIGGLFGLTPAEARLAALLAEGRPLKEVAKHLGVRITTARAHLASIFRKTGTHRQSELVRLLVGGLGQIRLER